MQICKKVYTLRSSVENTSVLLTTPPHLLFTNQKMLFQRQPSCISKAFKFKVLNIGTTVLHFPSQYLPPVVSFGFFGMLKFYHSTNYENYENEKFEESTKKIEITVNFAFVNTYFVDFSPK